MTDSIALAYALVAIAAIKAGAFMAASAYTTDEQKTWGLRFAGMAMLFSLIGLIPSGLAAQISYTRWDNLLLSSAVLASGGLIGVAALWIGGRIGAFWRERKAA